MNARIKPWVLILTVVVVAALFLLAIGLTQMDLQPGNLNAFSFGGSSNLNLTSQPEASTDYLNVLRILYIIGIVLLPAIIVLLIVSKQARKQFLRSLIAVFPILLLLFVLQKMREQNGQQQPEVTTPPIGAPPPAGAGTNPFLVTINHLPPWVIITGTVIVALIVTGLVMGIAWFFWKRSHPPEDSIDLIGQEAQNAIDALKSGENLKNVVIRCYFQMNEIINKERGVRRDEAMTPREFIKRLEAIGLPGSAIRELTRLFEEVRYGTRLPGLEDEVVAMASLNSIVDACKSS